MKNITVNDILDLLFDSSLIQIFVNGRTYEFPVCEFPEEIGYMRVHTIDDPYYYGNVHALCLNIDYDEVEDLETFREEYSDYEI